MLCGFAPAGLIAICRDRTVAGAVGSQRNSLSRRRGLGWAIGSSPRGSIGCLSLSSLAAAFSTITTDADGHKQTNLHSLHLLPSGLPSPTLSIRQRGPVEWRPGRHSSSRPHMLAAPTRRGEGSRAPTRLAQWAGRLTFEHTLPTPTQPCPHRQVNHQIGEIQISRSDLDRRESGQSASQRADGSAAPRMAADVSKFHFRLVLLGSDGTG